MIFNLHPSFDAAIEQLSYDTIQYYVLFGELVYSKVLRLVLKKLLTEYIQNDPQIQFLNPALYINDRVAQSNQIDLEYPFDKLIAEYFNQLPWSKIRSIFIKLKINLADYIDNSTDDVKTINNLYQQLHYIDGSYYTATNERPFDFKLFP